MQANLDLPSSGRETETELNWAEDWRSGLVTAGWVILGGRARATHTSVGCVEFPLKGKDVPLGKILGRDGSWDRKCNSGAG